MRPSHALAAASALAFFAIVTTSHADDTDDASTATSPVVATTSAPKIEDTAAKADDDATPSRPHIVTDVRFGGLFRSDSDYFSEAETFGYPVPSVAAGIVGTVGVEVVPRLTFAVAGSYYAEGAKRRFAKLSISSDALLAQIRFAVLRVDANKDAPLAGAVEIVGGGGKYWIREAYSDPSLFAGTIEHDGTSFGFSLGADAWVAIGPARLVLGYAYHWAPAGVKNDIGGEVRAGGHEITFGLGARF